MTMIERVARMQSVIERLEKRDGPDRDLDQDVAEALGASVRRVSKLGLNGRTPGSYRAFWQRADPFGPGSAIPYYTKDRARAKAKLLKALEALSEEEERG